ncbi:MAG TPA: hypothetical protein VH797_11145 [Nitrososphaeraceae archaeon]|jgi:hypothetical protein
MYDHNLFLLIGMILTAVAFTDTPISYAEKRECKDLTRQINYNSEDHDDNKESEKAFKKSLKQDSLCEFTEKHDKEELTGEVKDWGNYQKTEVYQTSSKEQKECQKEGFISPDDGEKALQGYEIEYCGWDED